MTRIIGGHAGGRRLHAPRGNSTRPTSDRVREALFSALESQLGTLTGRRFLDIYAGSGAVGLEARSRGATAVTLVEHDRAAARLIRDNARELGFTDIAVVEGRAEKLADTPPPDRPFEVAFLDPPYALPGDEVAAVVADLGQAGWLSDDVLVVVERSKRDAEMSWPEGFEAIQSRRYGETVLWYGRRAARPHRRP